MGRQWSHLFEENDDQVVLRVDFYINGQEDPTLTFRCTTYFIVSYVQWYNITLSLPVSCYTFGTHSRSSREWEWQLVIGIRVPLGRQINDNDTFLAIIHFIGLKFGTLSVRVKRPHAFGRFGTKPWRLMSGG